MDPQPLEPLTPPGPLPTIIHVPCASDHYEIGRAGQGVRYCILHNTEAWDDSVAWLSGASYPPASIHAIFQRDGSRTNIVQYADTAWHTGYCKLPYSRYNTVGAEFANASNHWGVKEAYTPAQLNTGAHWVATIRFSYGLPAGRVTTHAQIAVWGPNAPPHKPGELRRYDPSAFPMPPFLVQVEAWLDFFRSLKPEDHAKWII